jgi:hypothetical protein
MMELRSISLRIVPDPVQSATAFAITLDAVLAAAQG